MVMRTPGIAVEYSRWDGAVGNGSAPIVGGIPLKCKDRGSSLHRVSCAQGASVLWRGGSVKSYLFVDLRQCGFHEEMLVMNEYWEARFPASISSRSIQFDRARADRTPFHR